MKDHAKVVPTASAPPLHDQQEPLLSNQEESDEIPVVDALPIAVAQDIETPFFNSTPQGVPVSSILVEPEPVPSTTVTTTVVTSYVPENFGRDSVKVKCPYCKNEGYTRVNQEMSIGTLLWMIFSVLVFWPLLFCVCCSPSVS